MILRIGNKKRKQRSRVKGQGSRKYFGIRSLTLRSMTHDPKSGLTLIEVMAAVAILAIGIVGVLQAYAGSVSTLEIGQFNIDAINLLKQKVADVEQTILEQEDPPRSDMGTVDDFHWEWNITSTSTEDLNKLTVTVSHEYNPRTFVINTYVVDKKEED